MELPEKAENGIELEIFVERRVLRNLLLLTRGVGVLENAEQFLP